MIIPGKTISPSPIIPHEILYFSGTNNFIGKFIFYPTKTITD